jgi:arylsulfatase A-like enzyme
MPEKLRGRSLRPAIDERRTLDREAVFAHLATSPEDLGKQARMVRTSRFKYNAYSEGANPEEFFDLENDPGEMRNLAGDPTFAAQQQRHRDLLDAWLTETNDPFRPFYA